MEPFILIDNLLRLVSLMISIVQRSLAQAAQISILTVLVLSPLMLLIKDTQHCKEAIKSHQMWKRIQLYKKRSSSKSSKRPRVWETNLRNNLKCNPKDEIQRWSLKKLEGSGIAVRAWTPLWLQYITSFLLPCLVADLMARSTLYKTSTMERSLPWKS